MDPVALLRTHFIVNTVEQSRNHREDGGLEVLQVVRQQSDVSLEEAHPAPSTIQNHLKEPRRTSVYTRRLDNQLTL